MKSRLLAACGLAALWLMPFVCAAEDPEFPPAAKPADGPEAKALREQTIYVPYDKLRQVFEQHGRGVFLPYEKFQELWLAAQKAARPAADNKPPVGALITAIENEATVAKDVLRVKARLKIDLLAEGWHELPLRLADAAILTAKLKNEPARIVGGPDRGYSLLLHKQGKEPEQVELVLEYAKAITKTPGQNSVAIETPQAPVSRWQVRIAEAGVKLNVQPSIATADVPVEKPAGEKAPGKPAGAEKPVEETSVLAFVGAAPTVRIDWTPKAEGAAGMEALATVQTEQVVWISEGVVRCNATLGYAISRAELRQVAIEVPANTKVVNLSDANVRQWTVETAAGVQKITVHFFEPAKTYQKLALELERLVADKDGGALQLPVIKALGAGRQAGVLVVGVGQGLRAEAARSTGLLQTDAAELPPNLARNAWAFAYRYSAVPFELVLAVEKVQPRVAVDTLVEAYLEPNQITLDLTALYTIERAGLFRLELDVPAGYDVRQVIGRSLPGVAAVQVDAFHLEGDAKRRLLVELSHKALGRVGLGVELHKDLQEPKLITPTDLPADIPIVLPRVKADAAQRNAGSLVIYAPESLRVNPAKTEGLRSISFNEAFQPVVSVRNGKLPMLRPVLAFAHAQEAVNLVLAANRKKPQVKIDQLLIARIEDGAVKYQASLVYDVQYSGVKSLRVDVPKAVSSKLRCNTPGIREQKLDPQPKDVDAGNVAWSLSGQSELLGQGRIELGWEDEQEMGKLQVGHSVTLLIPRLQPREVDNARGQIVLAKAETIDIDEADDPKPQGLQPIDPQHDLRQHAPVPGAARAFQFEEAWKLAVKATRYRLEEVKRTSIERAVVRMVLTRADQVSVQALYRMRSARQRLDVALPKEVKFDTNAVQINGRAVPLERGDKELYCIPLAGQTPDESFILELRYTMPRNGDRLDLPNFGDDLAVQKVYACVYVPEERTLLERRGPWTEEFDWYCGRHFTWYPVVRTRDGTDRGLIEDLRAGAPAGQQPGDTFPTDGRLYVFSALQPAAPPHGSLHLVIVRQSWLTGVVLGIVVLLGLLLLPGCACSRMTVSGIAIIALVLGGLFWPIAAWQIVNGVLAAAVLVVLIVWTVWHFARKARKCITKAPCATATAQLAEAVSALPPEQPPQESQEEGGKSDA